MLVEHHFQAKTADGRLINLQGFKAVDRAVFAKLPDATLAEWHRAGYLALVHFHLASLDRFQEMLTLLQTTSAIPAA
jgi:hypothetical protein